LNYAAACCPLVAFSPHAANVVTSLSSPKAKAVDCTVGPHGTVITLAALGG
jgi:hypothetical protein